MPCAGNGCNGVLTCGCPPKKEPEQRHKLKRFHIGPKTAEIALELGRNPQAGLFSGMDLELRLSRLYCGPCKEPDATFKPYGSEGDTYFFSFTGPFMSDPKKYPKGFYLGELWWRDCLVDRMEFVKAPGVYVKDAMSTSDQCVTVTEFVEPPCEVKPCFEPVHPPECDCRICKKKYRIRKAITESPYLSNLDNLFEEDTNG